GIQAVLGSAAKRAANLADAEQLDGLADQVAVVVPLHAQGIEAVLLAIAVAVVTAVGQGGDGERTQFIVPELVTRTGTQGALTLDFLDAIALVLEAALPEPFLGEEAVQRVFGTPVVGTDHVVLQFTVVVGKCVVPPQTMTRLGLDTDIVVVGAALTPLVVQAAVDLAL